MSEMLVEAIISVFLETSIILLRYLVMTNPSITCGIGTRFVQNIFHILRARSFVENQTGVKGNKIRAS